MGEKADSPTFAERYYAWSLDQWDVELRTDMQRLRSIRSRPTQKAIMALETCEIAERREIVKALTKRFHPAACASLGTPLSAREKVGLAKYDTTRQQVFRPDIAHGSSSVRKKMGLCLRDGLGFLGVSTSLGGVAEWKHMLASPPWMIETRVAALSRFGETSLSHRIVGPDGAILADFVSFCAALGVSSETSWSVESEAQVKEAASGIVALSRWFLDQVLLLLHMTGR